MEPVATKKDFGSAVLPTKTIGNYIVDFFAPAARLVIEVDGAHHFEVTKAKYDKKRSEYLEQLGLKVLRFDDRQVLTQKDEVIEEVFRSMVKEP